MHRTHPSVTGIPLIHTTDLLDGQLRGECRRTSVSSRSFRGPVVLVPRVGRPIQSKVVQLNLRSEVALSDCVIALECASEEVSVAVRNAIQDRWTEFEDAYGGSCAPYITLRALQEVLGCFGFGSQVRQASRSPADLEWRRLPARRREPRTGAPGLGHCGDVSGERGLAQSRADSCVQLMTPSRRRERHVEASSQLGNSAARLSHTRDQKSSQGWHR